MERNSNCKKCGKREKLEKVETKKAIKTGNMDIARNHAESAFRQKSQSVNYLQMCARIDAVASRAQMAIIKRSYFSADDDSNR